MLSTTLSLQILCHVGGLSLPLVTKFHNLGIHFNPSPTKLVGLRKWICPSDRSFVRPLVRPSHLCGFHAFRKKNKTLIGLISNLVIRSLSLLWRHNGHNSVWNHHAASRLFTQPFIQTQIKVNIKAPRHWPLCGEFTGTGEFPAQMASYAENVSIWWRHHDGIPKAWLTIGYALLIFLSSFRPISNLVDTFIMVLPRPDSL